MSSKKFVVGALLTAGVLAAGVAQARTDVQWSVSIGVPIGVPVYSQPYPVYQYEPAYPVYRRAVPVYESYPVYQPAYPVYTRPAYPRQGYRHGYRQASRWDVDGDGIPNRRDPVYNPRWDRDGDGIPNWREEGRRHGR